MRRDSLTMIAGMLLRICLQASYFIVVARSLGVEGYGAFSAVLAMTALLVPFASFGTGHLMVRNVRRNPESAPIQWATAVQITLISGLGLTAALVVAGVFLAPPSVSWLVLICVGLSDLVGARLVEVAGQAHLAVGRVRQTAALPLWLMTVRLGAAGCLVAGPWDVSPSTWAWLYLISTAPVALVTVLFTSKSVGPAAADLRAFRAEWREGAYFSASQSSQGIYNDADKAILGRLGSLEATGLYTAAYRVVDVAFAPMRGLLAAAYPRFFDTQTSGIRATLAFTRRLSLPAVALGAGATLGLLLFADLVPVILGSTYDEAVGAIRALAVLPLLKVAHYLPADTLTGSGYQRERTLTQAVVAGLNVTLCLLIIPHYSWQGAVFASLVSDSLLALTLWSIVVRKVRKESRGPTRLALGTAGGTRSFTRAPTRRARDARDNNTERR